MTIEPLLRIEDAASSLGVHRSTIQCWRDRGCPSYRILGMTRFRLSEIQAWREAQKPLSKSPRPLKRGVIYFVGAADGSPVKIGWTVRVDGRIPSLQTGAWTELVCLGTIAGTQADEAAIHEKLAAHRIRGEWFQRDAALALLAARKELVA